MKKWVIFLSIIILLSATFIIYFYTANSSTFQCYIEKTNTCKEVQKSVDCTGKLFPTSAECNDYMKKQQKSGSCFNQVKDIKTCDIVNDSDECTSPGIFFDTSQECEDYIKNNNQLGACFKDYGCQLCSNQHICCASGLYFTTMDKCEDYMNNIKNKKGFCFTNKNGPSCSEVDNNDDCPPPGIFFKTLQECKNAQ